MSAVRSIGWMAILWLCAGCGGATVHDDNDPTGPAAYFLAIEHTSDFESQFRWVGLEVSVDDHVVFSQAITEAQEEADAEAELSSPVCVYRQSLQAGTHDVRVKVNLRGRGYGVFSYLQGYRFEVNSRYAVELPTRSFGVHLDSRAFAGGDPETPLEDRPRFAWATRVEEAEPNGGCRP